MTWLIITVILLVLLGVFAYKFPDLFRKTVKDTTNTIKQEIKKVTQK